MHSNFEKPTCSRQLMLDLKNKSKFGHEPFYLSFSAGRDKLVKNQLTKLDFNLILIQIILFDFRWLYDDFWMIHTDIRNEPRFLNVWLKMMKKKKTQQFLKNRKQKKTLTSIAFFQVYCLANNCINHIVYLHISFDSPLYILWVHSMSPYYSIVYVLRIT